MLVRVRAPAAGCASKYVKSKFARNLGDGDVLAKELQIRHAARSRLDERYRPF
jgi:hypothetical protein